MIHKNTEIRDGSHLFQVDVFHQQVSYDCDIKLRKQTFVLADHLNIEELIRTDHDS